MVDLNIPKPELVTAEPPQTRVGGDAFQRTPQISIGPGLESLGSGLMELATPLATKAGQEDAAAVTRDANGLPQMGVSPSSFIVGPAGLAYQRAAEAGLLAQGRTGVAKTMVDINAENQGNPAELLAKTRDFAESLRTKFPGTLGIALAGHADTLGQQYYAGQVNEQTTAETNNSKTAIIAQIAQAKTDALQLAKAPGGTDTPEFKDSLKNINGFYQQLVDNPVYGMPTEKAEIEKKNFADYAQASAVQAGVDREFNRSGRAGAQKKLEDEILNNPKLSIDEKDRQHLYSAGMARLAYLTSDQQAQREANRSAVDGFWDGLKNGKVQPDDPMLDLAIERTKALGDDLGAQKLGAARQDAFRIQGLRGLSNGQRLTTMQNGAGAGNLGVVNQVYRGDPNQPGPNGGPSAAGLYSYYISKGASRNEAVLLTGAAASESGLNPAATHDPDPNGNPTGYGMFGHRLDRRDAMFSDAGTRAPNWQQQADFALKELRSRPEGATVNSATTPEQLAAAQMHFEKPQGYTSDTPTAGLNYTGRLNTIRRFSSLDGSAPIPEVMPASSNGVPYTREQVAANPFLLTAYVQSSARDADAKISTMRNTGQAIATGLDHDQLPQAETLAMFRQAAIDHPDQLGDQADALSAKLRGNQLAFAAANMPDAQGRSYIDRVTELTQGSSLYDQLVAREAKSSYDRRVAALRDDPHNEALYRGWISQRPATLDFTNPQALAVGMQQRGAAATVIGSHENDPDQSAFPKNELDQVKAVATGGPLDQRVSALRAMASAGWSDRVYKTTMQALASAPETQVMAVAGSVARDNFDAARGILEGQALLQADPKLGPRDADRETAFMKAFPTADFRDGQMRTAVLKATEAYYASLSAGANDSSQTFKQDRWDQAFKAVTGGVYSFRGSSVFAPFYGASEGQFRASVQSLTDADVQGAITADGTPFPAAALKSRDIFTSGNWRLQSAGDGRYLVFSGDDANRRYLQRDRIDARDPGGAFILDLSNRKGIEEPSASAYLPPPVLAPDRLPTDMRATSDVKPWLPVSTEMGQAGRTAP